MADTPKKTAFPPEVAADLFADGPLGAGAISIPSLRILAANDLLRQLLGFADSTLPGNAPLPECLSADLAEDLVPLIDRAAEGAAVHEDVLMPREASIRWVEVRLAPLRRADGTVYAVALLAADATERKRAEEDLRESEKKARAAIETAVEGIITIDADGIVESFNPAAARIFGYGPEEVIGNNVSMLMPEPYRTHHDSYIRRYLATGEAHIIGIGREVVGQRKDGTIFPMELAVSEVRLVDHVHFTALIRDITERKQAEDALREARRQAEDAYRREERIARRFQSALLPREEIRVPGYAIAHSYRPALVEADVGGDFYNLFEIDERYLGVVVGDVGGKGLEAAVLAARAQHTIMALALQDPLRPDLVLEAARHPISALEPDRILTLFLGILERDSGRLLCASAGHEQPLLWHAAEGRLEVLCLDGPAFFGIPAGSYTLRDARLQEGDFLFLYTDGLPDARRDRERLGIERVGDLITRLAGSEPEAVLNALYDAAVEHSQGRLRDDIVLMVIRRDSARREGISIFVAPPAMHERLEVPGIRPD